LSSNLISFHDGSVGFCLNIKTKQENFNHIKISSIDSMNRAITGLPDSPTRLDILNNVIKYLPNSEYIKFNIFKRLVNDPRRSKLLASIDFGVFEKFKEYKGIIDLHKLYSISSLRREDIEEYQNKFNDAGTLVLDELLKTNGAFSDSLKKIINSKK
jgi:hypothetical protein